MSIVFCAEFFFQSEIIEPAALLEQALQCVLKNPELKVEEADLNSNNQALSSEAFSLVVPPAKLDAHFLFPVMVPPSIKSGKAGNWELVQKWATLSVKNKAYQQHFREDPRLNGSLSLSFKGINPFIEGHYQREVWLAGKKVPVHWEENVERLLGILLDLVTALQPRCMKVFLDNDLFFPFNARLAYYTNEEVVLEDLAFIKHLWEAGLPEYKVKPFKDSWHSAIRDDYSSGRRLWEELQQKLPLLDKVNLLSVKNLLASNKFDTQSLATGGFYLLNYPNFLGTYLDNFYLALLNWDLKSAAPGTN